LSITLLKGQTDMRYSFRLAELLGHSPDPRKRPGTIKSIVEYTGLDRHQVSALLKNEVKYIPLQALSRLCDYLIEQGHTTADQLPGALFSVEAEDFWELLAGRNRLELCVGVRSEEELPESSWIVAADSVLMGELLNGVSTLGGTAKHRYGKDSAAKPHPEYLKQSLVWSPGQADETEVRERAEEAYEDFHRSPGDKALVCLGSVKSNPVVELIMATSFGCTPLKPRTPWPHAGRAAVPDFPSLPRIMTPTSHPAAADCKVAQDTAVGRFPASTTRRKRGAGKSVAWDEPEQDAALRILRAPRVPRVSRNGCSPAFSGRSTRLSGQNARRRRAQDFWPPVYRAHGLQVGAYIVKYNLSAGHDRTRDMLRTDLVATTKVIPLEEEVLARRLAL
jgi:hypothetical protein